MKRTTRLVLSVIRRLNLDSVFAGIPPEFRLLKKLVPHPAFYKPDDEIVIKRNGALFCINRSDWMQWHIYANLEDNSWKYAKKLIEKMQLNPVVVLDIGSNVGAFSFKLAGNLLKNGVNNFSIYAFDPNPYIKKRFEINLNINPSFKNKIKFHPWGVFDKPGTAFFDFTYQNTGTGSIQDKGFKIEVTTLDAFCEIIKARNINFVKIDVEGYEPFVFDGGRKMIEKFRPVIYTEISPFLYNEKGRSAMEIFSYLQDIHYKLYLDKGKQPVLMDSNKMETLLKQYQFNILAIPN